MIIIIPGQPISKMRARTTIRKRKVVTFDPQIDDKLAVSWKMKSISKSPPTHDPIRVRLDFYVQPIHGDKQRSQKLWGIIPCTSKKDLDNMVKFYLDCGNKILYHDDSQITSIHCSQYWSENPRTEITVMKHDKEKLKDLTEEEKDILMTFSPEQFDFFATQIYDMFHEEDFSFGGKFSDEIDYKEKVSKIINFSRDFYPIITKINRILAKRTHGR